MSKRRPWGSAIEKRGRWYAVYSGPRKPNGARNQVWEQALSAGLPNTRQGAMNLLAVRRAELAQGEWQNPNASLPFRVLSDEWWEAISPLWRLNTRVIYRVMLRNHLIPALGSLDARSIDSSVLQRLIGQKIKSGLSGRYVREIIQLAKGILGYGHKHGHLKHPLVFHLDLPKINNKEVDPYTPEEVRLLLDAAGQWRPLIAFAVWTGCRQGEILAARWQHLDLGKGTYKVVHNLNRDLELAPPKNGEVGEVWISPILQEELAQQRAQLAQWQLSANSWEDHDLIFPREASGIPLRYTTLNSAYRRICSEAGVAYRSFHSLRHTCASLLLAQGESIKLVQKQLRHRDVKVTLSTYAHLMPEAGPEALKKLDATIMGV
jgi:integrase